MYKKPYSSVRFLLPSKMIQIQNKPKLLNYKPENTKTCGHIGPLSRKKTQKTKHTHINYRYAQTSGSPTQRLYMYVDVDVQSM